MTQEKLGFEAGLERIYISLLERGQRSLAAILDLARAFGTIATDMVSRVENKIGPKKR